MKTTMVKRLFVGMLLAGMAFTVIHAADDTKENRKKDNAKHVLVVGLNDNVRSNYFPGQMITEETGIPTDSIDVTYNRAIAENIATATKDENYVFVPACSKQQWGNVLNEIKLSGSDEETYADLSEVDKASMEKMLDEAGADYVLILNQHYLKWQEQPMRTMFHFVTYSLYDKDKKEITRGSNYFTCMKPEDADQIRKTSRKSTSKIASTVIKNISNK